MKEAETIHLLIYDQENQAESIDPSITVIKTFPEYGLKHVEIPRYMHFTEIARKIACQTNITCVNIAGQDKIQVDVKSPKGSILAYSGSRKIYEIPAPTELEYTYTALEVDTDQLFAVVRSLEDDNIEILFIHDY